MDVWDWMYDSKRIIFRDTPQTKWDKNSDGTHSLNIRPVKGGGGPSVTSFKGEYDPTATYNLGNITIISLGLNQGTFVCVSSSPISGISPTTGSPNWVQLPGGLLGQWF